MAANANTPGANLPDPRPKPSRVKEAAEKAQAPAPPPSSKPLQVFLLIALVITGAAYVVDEWTEMTTEETMAKHPNKLRRMVAVRAELVALALGVDPAALGLKRHVISPGPILQARELAQMHVA